ncbi:MAG TPA: hypothetical protein VE998_00215 [Terriglobales bacterium]|nr:hypothetical protein [Terriglobales bacterium]
MMRIADETLALWNDLLQQLPLPVRDSVRAAAELRAHQQAEESGGALTEEDGVRAFIAAVEPDLRANLRRTLDLHGIDSSEFDDLLNP